jgi:hypothetical protein
MGWGAWIVLVIYMKRKPKISQGIGNFTPSANICAVLWISKELGHSS